ncbi:hypothetical protein MC885_018582 [Smutsia gigantea]|nr:hypothetical protein MC885_018582 [Smutsia gigantea]
MRQQPPAGHRATSPGAPRRLRGSRLPAAELPRANFSGLPGLPAPSSRGRGGRKHMPPRERMLLLEYVKTVCFLTSERAGAQIFAASPSLPSRRGRQRKRRIWESPGKDSRQGKPPSSAPDLPAWSPPLGTANG